MTERICATCQMGNFDPLKYITPYIRGYCTANFESVNAHDTCRDWESGRRFTQAEIKEGT